MISPLQANPENSKKDLLEAIRGGASGINSASLHSSLGIPPLAALLIKLSDEANARANKIERATNRLLYVTILLFLISIFSLLEPFWK